VSSIFSTRSTENQPGCGRSSSLTLVPHLSLPVIRTLVITLVPTDRRFVRPLPVPIGESISGLGIQSGGEFEKVTFSTTNRLPPLLGSARWGLLQDQGGAGQQRSCLRERSGPGTKSKKVNRARALQAGFSVGRAKEMIATVGWQENDAKPRAETWPLVVDDEVIAVAERQSCLEIVRVRSRDSQSRAARQGHPAAGGDPTA